MVGRSSPPLLRWFLAYPLLGTSSHRWLTAAANCLNHQQSAAYSFRPNFDVTPASRSATGNLRPTTRPSFVLFSTTRTAYYDSDLITSTSSKTVKNFVNLQQKAKQRREAGETVVEGPRMVLDLLKNPDTRKLVQQIVVSTDLDESIREELDNQLYYNIGENDQHSIRVQTALPAVVKACSDTVTPQGIVARVQIPPWDATDINPHEKDKQKEPKRAPLYLVLDGVSDPGNVGTLLRSSVAVGVSAVILLPGSCDVWNPKAVRSAMGGSFLVPTFSVSSWPAALEQLNEWGCRGIWAATMLEDNQGRVLSTSHYDIDWNSQAQALVIGSEGNGLSPVIRDSLADDKDMIQAVHVPMQGSIESLNAAVCGSVILFEYMRQWQQQAR